MYYLTILFVTISLYVFSQNGECPDVENERFTGSCVEFYPGGATRRELNYDHSFLHGDYREYYESGGLMAEARLRMGDLVGNAYRYYPDSTIEIAIELDSTACGIFTHYARGGKRVLRTGKVKFGYRDSVWTSYSWRGEQRERNYFNADSIIELGNRGDVLLIFEEERIATVFLDEYGIGPIVSPETIVDFPDVEAVYGNGTTDLGSFFSDNLKYPPKALKNQISGKVYLSFIVELDGSVSNVKIERSAHPLLDEEAARVLKLLKDWKPAIYKGQNIRSRCRIPVVFNL